MYLLASFCWHYEVTQDQNKKLFFKVTSQQKGEDLKNWKDYNVVTNTGLFSKFYQKGKKETGEEANNNTKHAAGIEAVLFFCRIF